MRPGLPDIGQVDGGSRNTVLILLAVAFAALLVPLAVAPFPPLTDYPNHLARLFLLTGGISLPRVAEMYQVTWDTPSNIGIDLLAALLGPVLGYETIGRICVALATLLPPLGGVLLARVVHGRFHWWQLSFGLIAWNTGLLVGLLNFQIGLGLALLAAAADPFLTRHGAVASLAGRACFGALALVVHPFAILFYGALLGGLALGRLAPNGPTPGGPPPGRWLRDRAGSLLAVAVALALPLLLLSVLARSLPGNHTGLDIAALRHDFAKGFADLANLPGYKVRSALIGVRTYSQWLDLLTILALLLPVALALVTRRLAVHGGMLLAFGGLVLCYLAFPHVLAGSTWVDRRFALMATLVFVVCLCPDLPRVPGRAAMAGILLLGLVKTGVVGWIWYQRQADVGAVYRVLDSVPPGAAILPVAHRPADQGVAPAGRYTTMDSPSFRHLPNLALPWRQAFVPTLFTAQGTQPLRVLPPWDRVAVTASVLVSVNVLTRPDRIAGVASYAGYVVQDWARVYDYVLVVNADVPDQDGVFQPPAGVRLVRDEGFARLYRIDRQPG